MNLATTSPTDDMGTTESGRRFAARGVITRRNGHQTTTIVGEAGGIGHSTPLVAKGDTRRQVAERLAGGAR